MRLVRNPRLRRIVSGIMLLAIAAFLQQGSFAISAQAAAAVGFMPQPAEIVIGSIHVHGKVGGHVHKHDSENAAGHTHDHAHHGEVDEPGSTLFWTLGGLSAVLSQAASATLAFITLSAEQAARADHCDGIEPDGSSRPPSTPSIA
jgi:hypothetical protein